jgi:succinate dehydrogenase / fumarate reductase, cytochrome b subunit
MQGLVAVLATSVGRKALVAGSGLVFAGWCALHVLGNTAAFAGQTALDGYAAWLRRGFGLPLWGLRLLLLAVVGTHVILAVALWRRARVARPQRYRQERAVAAGLATRLVRWCGVALGGFTVFHVLHINYGLALPGFVRGHVYQNLALAFASPVMTGLYVVAALLVGLHLAHGLAASLSSLGLLPPSTWTRRLAALFGSLLVVGFAATPLGMALGVLP